MSTVTIISALIVLLATLVCYAFVYQTVQHKREKRVRLLAALKARARSFKFIISGCPEGFLPKELLILVQRSLIEVLEQLARMEPGEKAHPEDLQALSAQLVETQRQSRPAQPVSLVSMQQIKETRVCLEELHRFVFQQEERKALARNQAEAYRNQIKQLVLQMTVDGYCLNGRTAKQKNKLKLAIHYYDLALNLLIREQRGTKQVGNIERLRAIISELKVELAEEETQTPAASKPSADHVVSGEWDKFGENENTWKKKNVYD